MRYLAIITFLVASLTCLEAQKIGYMNLGNLLASLPETKSADSAIKKLNEESTNELEGLAKKLEAKALQFQKDVQSGALSPQQQTTQQEALQKEQQALLLKEQQLSQKIQQKRQELLQPILLKIENAVKSYAQSNGYNMILDSSVPNFILFAKEAEDLTETIKSSL